MDAPTDEDLIEATLKGDGEGFATLVHRYKGKISRLAANFARDRFQPWTTCARTFFSRPTSTSVGFETTRPSSTGLPG